MHTYSNGWVIMALFCKIHWFSNFRGHRVTTVRFADKHGLRLRPLGANHTEIVLHLDNTAGDIPYTSAGRDGRFAMPMELLWSDGNSLATLLKLAQDPWKVVRTYCDQLLGNDDLIARLRRTPFDVAVVDLIYNECGLAMASHVLAVPATVGYWAFSFSSGEPELTAAATPASHVPAFMSEFTQDMTFGQRASNLGLKAFARLLMLYHTWVCDGVVGKHFPEAPPSAQLLADLNGALINSDSVLDYPRLQPETFLNVGGMQIKERASPLPEVTYSRTSILSTSAN